MTLADDPWPGWAGLATLFGAPVGNLTTPSRADIAVAGVPFDSTASSRPGAAEGPSAIRLASRVYSANFASLGEHEMFDTRTGHSCRYRTASITDVGDLHVYPSDIARTIETVSVEAERVAQIAKTTIFLGGDHSVSYPLFVGVQNALRRAEPAATLGYIQVDHHFDFGQHSRLHGPVYHGSNARRISERLDGGPARFAFVGVGALTRKDQYLSLQERGVPIVSAAEIRAKGAGVALAPLLAAFSETCTHVYLSIDIDVLDASVAPGTGGVTVGGLDGGGLMDVVHALGQLPLKAIDVVEVAPRYDPTGRTALIAAHTLFEMTHRVRL